LKVNKIETAQWITEAMSIIGGGTLSEKTTVFEFIKQEWKEKDGNLSLEFSKVPFVMWRDRPDGGPDVMIPVIDVFESSLIALLYAKIMNDLNANGIKSFMSIDIPGFQAYKALVNGKFEEYVRSACAVTGRYEVLAIDEKGNHVLGPSADCVTVLKQGNVAIIRDEDGPFF
jgi:hypothetical protein